MPLLAVPNWSFGRQLSLLRSVKDYLESQPVTTHFCASDPDHNRTVTAFSGSLEQVEQTLIGLAEIILPCIDLQRHVGVHPRIGALDVCPFIPIPHLPKSVSLQPWIESIALKLATRYDLPVFLYEDSARANGHVKDLPSLRKGGFGGLFHRPFRPDFGPDHPHPQLGATVLGQRGFLIALNVLMRDDEVHKVERIAADLRKLRREGEPRFQGVRSLGLRLSSQGLTQVSLNVTQPDFTPVDPILEWVFSQAELYGLDVAYTELIGVIRDVDMEHNTHLPARSEQIVNTRGQAW